MIDFINKSLNHLLFTLTEKTNNVSKNIIYLIIPFCLCIFFYKIISQNYNCYLLLQRQPKLLVLVLIFSF